MQLSYLGYFAPSYLKAIDGWIGDQALFAGLDEVDRDAHKLWMVQGGYMAYDPADPYRPGAQSGQTLPLRQLQPFTQVESGHGGLVCRSPGGDTEQRAGAEKHQLCGKSGTRAGHRGPAERPALTKIGL